MPRLNNNCRFGLNPFRLTALQISDPPLPHFADFSKTNFFQRLPPETIHIILNLLSSLDKVSFAMSDRDVYMCLRRYARYHLLIGDKNWRVASMILFLMPEGPRFKRYWAIVEPTYPVYRAELLLRLGDERSVYCRTCHNIHKRSIRRGLRSLFNLKPQCSSLHTEVVDICPCAAMTFEDTRDCILNTQTPEAERPYWKGSGPSLGCETGNMQFTHQCTFKEHLLATVHTNTRVWFDEGSKSLQVQNLFRFDVSGLTPAQLKRLGKSDINKCMHQDAKEWLQEFFRESKANLDMKVLGSDYCQWLGWEESKTDESLKAFEIILHRDLGGVHWPNKGWMNYSHKRLRPPCTDKLSYFLEPSHL